MAPTKEELLGELKQHGTIADPKLTNAELQGLLDEVKANAAEYDFLGTIEKYALSEEDAYAYNRERDGLSRFLKASRGGPLPGVRVSEGDVVPVIVNALTPAGELCGNAQMPGGGVLWIEGFEPYVEGE